MPAAPLEGADGVLLASLACYEAASRAFEGTLEDGNYDEITQITRSWGGLLAPSHDADGKARLTQDSGFVDIAIALSRLVPPKGSSGVSPTVLEKEVKVFRDPEEEAQGVFLLRALTHLCKYLADHEQACVVVESCDLRLVLVLPGGDKPMARPVLCFNPNPSRCGRARFHASEGKQPALMHFPGLKDAQTHVLGLLQGVWLRQSSGVGGHVSLWVVLRRGHTSATLIDHVQALRKKEKAMAIMKRRRELERLASRIMHTEAHQNEDGTSPAMRAASRGGEGAGSVPETEGEEESLAAYKAKTALRPPLSTTPRRIPCDRRAGGEGGPPEVDGPAIVSSTRGVFENGAEDGGHRGRQVEGQGEGKRPVGGEREQPATRQPLSRGRDEGEGEVEMGEEEKGAVVAKALPVPSPSASGEVSGHLPSAVLGSWAAGERRPPSASRFQEGCKGSPGAGVEGAPSPLEVQGRDQDQGYAMSPALALAPNTGEGEELGSVGLLLESVEAEDVEELSARVYEAVKGSVLRHHASSSRPTSQGTEEARGRTSPRLGASLDSGLQVYRRGEGKEDYAQVCGSREGEEEEGLASLGSSIAAGREKREEEGEEGLSWGEELGEDRVSALLESMDGEDIEVFGRRLYRACRAAALHGARGVPRRPAKRSEGEDGPRVAPPVGPTHTHAPNSPLVERDASPPLSHSPAAPRARSASPQRSPSPSPSPPRAVSPLAVALSQGTNLEEDNRSPLPSHRGARRSPPSPSDHGPSTAEPRLTPTPRQRERSVRSPLSDAGHGDQGPTSRCSSTGAEASSPAEGRPRSSSLGRGLRGEDKGRERHLEDEEEEEGEEEEREEPGVTPALRQTGAEARGPSRGEGRERERERTRSPVQEEGNGWEFGEEQWAVVIEQAAGGRRAGSRGGRDEDEGGSQEDEEGEEVEEEIVVVAPQSQGRGYGAPRRCYRHEAEQPSSLASQDDEPSPSPPPSYRDDRPSHRPPLDNAYDAHGYQPPSRSYELQDHTHGAAYHQQQEEGEGQGSEERVSPGEYDRYDRYHRESYNQHHPPMPLEEDDTQEEEAGAGGAGTPLARSLESGEFAGGAWGGEEEASHHGHGPSTGAHAQHHDDYDGYVHRQQQGRGESRSPSAYAYRGQGGQGLSARGRVGHAHRGPPSDASAYPHSQPLHEGYGSVAPGEYASGMGSAYRQPPTHDTAEWAHCRPLSRPLGEQGQGARRDEWADAQYAPATQAPSHRQDQPGLGPTACSREAEGRVGYDMSPEGPYSLEDEEEGEMDAAQGRACNGNGPLTHPLEASDGLMWEPRGPVERGPRAEAHTHRHTHEGRRPTATPRQTQHYDYDYDYHEQQARQPHAYLGHHERVPPPPTAPSPPLPPPCALCPVPPAYIPPPRSPIPRRRPRTYPRPQNVGGLGAAPGPMAGRSHAPPPSAPLPPSSFLPQLQQHHAPTRPQHHTHMQQPQHSWVGPAEPQACVPTSLLPSLCPPPARGAPPSFLAVRTGGALASGPFPPRPLPASSLHNAPVPPRRSYSDGDAMAAAPPASASHRHPRPPTHMPHMPEEAHTHTHTHTHGTVAGGQWQPKASYAPASASAYPEKEEEEEGGPPHTHNGRGQGHRPRDTRRQQQQPQDYVQAWPPSPSPHPPSDPAIRMSSDPPSYPPAPHPPPDGHGHRHAYQPPYGPHASQWNGWAPQAQVQRQLQHDPQVQLQLQHDPQVQLQQENGHRHGGQSGLLEWDVEGSQSPEERRRRQAKLEAVRARKMKEAQERDEARRQRQQQQQSQPSQRRASLDEGPPADAPRPSSRAAAAGPTCPDHCEGERPPAVSTKAAAIITSAPAGVAAAAPAGNVGKTGGRRLSGAGAAVKGRGLSNAKLLRNALQHVCLAGTIMAPQRQKALESMDGQGGGVNFLVLFNSSNALTFRGLYVLEGASGSRHDSMIRRVFGAGPMFIKDEWVEHFYKYNSAARTFQPLPCGRSFTLMTDGLTLDLSKLRRAAKDGLANATSSQAQHAEQAAKA